MKKLTRALFLIKTFILLPVFGFSQGFTETLEIGGIRIEFFLFAFTLLGVAVFHNHTFKVAVTGLASILAVKLLFSDFSIAHHLMEEWEILVNLLGLLLGFALLARHFEETEIPKILPDYLPNDWKGGFVLLVMIFIMSSFLDNIAAAMIGGAVAHIVFKGKVHIGYLAGIVGASNAGGSGSVVGDTTTTMMWIDGVSALYVLKAYGGAIPALLILGVFASKQQDKYNRIVRDSTVGVKIDWLRVLVVVLILAGAILTNIYLDFPAVGVWIAILIGAIFKKTDWKEVPKAIPGSFFLLCLVLSASMMPVEKLPPATWHTSFILGFISAVFDNIPLTKLALTQGGYDWGVLAYAVGFGGSMIWFGSSAGVALSNMYPEAKSVFNWIKNGWHVIVAYIVGFFIMISIFGWHPSPNHKEIKEDKVHIENQELKQY